MAAVYELPNNRHLWATVPCPTCKAAVGEECTYGFPAFHNARLTVYYEQLKRQEEEIIKDSI